MCVGITGLQRFPMSWPSHWPPQQRRGRRSRGTRKGGWAPPGSGGRCTVAPPTRRSWLYRESARLRPQLFCKMKVLGRFSDTFLIVQIRRDTSLLLYLFFESNYLQKDRKKQVKHCLYQDESDNKVQK